MGRVVKREVVAIRCELAAPRRGAPSCDAVMPVVPLPAGCVWEDQVLDLGRLVASGWAFVITPSLRSYCPQHADRVWDCTCRTHRDRAHLCTSHGDASELVWAQDLVPAEATAELARIGEAA